MSVMILGVLASAADRQSLRYIVDHSNWKLEFADGIETIQPILQESDPDVVITDCVLPDGNSWRDLLTAIQTQPSPPSLIVADRQADERIWVEVLNLGAYDLVVKPFDANEVFLVVSSAWRSWKYQYEKAERRRSAIASAMLLSRSAGV
jgi:two-component system nitrogen regulation response regulator GlnG